MVVGWNPAPNLSNSAPYDRCELLRKGAESRPYCRQSYQFYPGWVTNRAHQTERQFDSHLLNRTRVRNPFDASRTARISRITTLR